MFWLAEDLLEQRVREDKIPYDLWIEQGLVRTCPGNKVHAKYVTEWFLEVQNELDIYIPWVGYDSWSATYWVEEMRGIFGKESMVPVIQGKKTLSGPMKQLERDLESKLINYNNNPVTKWCLANTAKEEDKNGNIQPVKTSKRTKRIDGMAALLNAYTVLQDRLDEYQSLI
jgi:phage terminase large subunit-like protein